MIHILGLLVFITICFGIIFNVTANQEHIVTIKTLADTFLEKEDILIVNGVTQEAEKNNIMLTNYSINTKLNDTKEDPYFASDEITYKTTYKNIQKFKEKLKETFPKKTDI